MGGGQSNLNQKNSEYDEAGVCKPCFLFDSPLRSKDAIGSPMPETPVVHRRKRDEAISALREERRTDPVYSSKYFGIEKEVVEPKKQIKNVRRAEVHEGEVSEHNVFCCSWLSHIFLQNCTLKGRGNANASKVSADGSFGCWVDLDLSSLR